VLKGLSFALKGLSPHPITRCFDGRIFESALKTRLLKLDC
jgi:hypothetical protein